MLSWIRLWICLTMGSFALVPDTSAQTSLWLYGGITYAQTELRSTLPDPHAIIFGDEVQPIMQPQMGLTLAQEWKWLSLHLSSGHQAQGFHCYRITEDRRTTRSLHYIPVQADLLLRFPGGPAWLQRASLGGGGQLLFLLNRPRQTLWQFSRTSVDNLMVPGWQAQLQYELSDQLRLAVQYSHGGQPYATIYTADGADFTEFFYRVWGLRLAYRLGK